ncbi:hypothetical protein ACIGBH_36100 [Streptomyces sp. NPDC085929]|uniref:hypothetical protein n=1 Tax=Streptomyces sp. NPDC085929 TaxID=3365739 RepID=UPI0037D1A676
MAIPKTVEAWHRVESRPDLVAYLLLLSAEDEAARAHRGIDGFLWGWVTVLDRHLDGTAALGGGWRGLACQLYRARTAEPRQDPALAEPPTDEDAVSDAADLRRYVATLAVDFARDRREMHARAARGLWAGDGGSWAHGTPHAWLDSWAAWLAATRWAHELEPVTWRSIAEQLSAAQIYE